MSAHTPGPWQACSCGHCGLVWSLPGDYCVADVLGADSALADQEPLPKEAREANARLIAAAPDLLAALVDLRQFVDEFVPRDVVEDPDDIEDRARFMGAARSAIAKARGDE